MSRLHVPLATQLRVSTRGLGRVFGNPVYAGLWLVVFFLVLGCIVWFPNWRLLLDVWHGQTLGLGEKVTFLLEGYEGIVTNFEPAVALSLVSMALLFGATITLIVAIGASRADRARGGGGLLAGIVGAGCAACGTSLAAPVLSAVGAGSSLAVSQAIGTIANLLAILLLGYSVFRLGQQAASYPPHVKDKSP